MIAVCDVYVLFMPISLWIITWIIQDFPDYYHNFRDKLSFKMKRPRENTTKAEQEIPVT